jgi:hypothetical protein
MLRRDGSHGCVAGRRDPDDAQLESSAAIYRQIIGAEPKRLEPASSIGRMLPNSVKDFIGGRNIPRSVRRKRCSTRLGSTRMRSAIACGRMWRRAMDCSTRAAFDPKGGV